MKYRAEEVEMTMIVNIFFVVDLGMGTVESGFCESSWTGFCFTTQDFFNSYQFQ